MGSPGGGADNGGGSVGGGSENGGQRETEESKSKGADKPDKKDSKDDQKAAFDDAKDKAEKEAKNKEDNSDRPDRAPAAPPSKPDTDDEDTRPSDNTDRPDRAPAAPPSMPETDDEDDQAAGPPGIGAPPSTPETSEASEPDDDPEDKEDGGGFLDSVGGFFGDLARDVQDIARENPRVDSYGNPRGFIDADGIQRGDVASRFMGSGLSPSELADHLGFSSPQDMAAAQNTDFIDQEYQEKKTAEAISILEDRYGKHPDLPSLLQAAGLMNNLVPNNEIPAYDPSLAFGDIEFGFNQINTLSMAEAKLQQGDIDGYYDEISKIDGYADLALEVRQNSSLSGQTARDFYHDVHSEMGYTKEQIDSLWAEDTLALARQDLDFRKAEIGQLGDAGVDFNDVDGVLDNDQIARYHEKVFGDRYEAWTGAAPQDVIGRWRADGPVEMATLTAEMMGHALLGNEQAQQWVGEVVFDLDSTVNTSWAMFGTARDALGNLAEDASDFVGGLVDGDSNE